MTAFPSPLRLLVASAWALSLTSASIFDPIKQLPLDIKPLGHVVLAGNFEGVSQYEYEGQKPNVANNGTAGNGSQSLSTPLPNGDLATLASADAAILAMCPLKGSDGSIESVVLGGNFTSLGGTKTGALALFSPSNNSVTAINGLSGRVMALLCDSKNGSVYVGGDFDVTNTSSANNASNIVLWSRKDGFQSLPFGGFDGPVTAIAETEDGTLIFGGAFGGLSNSSSSSSSSKGEQVINLSSAQVNASASSDNSEFSDPTAITCATKDKNGSGKSWLLPNNTAGYWRASMGYQYRPTKLRIWNTDQDDRGTKRFAFRALPLNGLLSMSYNETNGTTVSCDPGCDLPEYKDEKYREFVFDHKIGMDAFQIEVWDWYGSGGGLGGVELLTDDINAYAVSNFNEPSCSNLQFASKSTSSGNWSQESSSQSSSDYLKASIGTSTQGKLPSVTFEPDVKQAGNYSVLLYTPGCASDSSCQRRGQVNVTVESSSDAEKKVQTIWQTNENEKYDSIYYGHVEPASSFFRPKVTLSAMEGAQGMDIVASYVRFELKNSTGGLKGLFEYDPRNSTVDIDKLDSMALAKAGTRFNSEAQIDAITSVKNTTFLAGNFTYADTDDSDKLHNIVAFDDQKIKSLADDGLNNQVNALLSLDGLIYVGGSFTGTSGNGNQTSIHNAAAYDPKKKEWSQLNGKGLDGPVRYIAKFPVNVTSGSTETAVAFSGSFTKILAKSGSDDDISASGFAVWVPSKKDWLQNIKGINRSTYHGQLTASLIFNNTALLAGNLTSGGLRSPGAVGLVNLGNEKVGIEKYPVDITSNTSSSSTLTKRNVDAGQSKSATGPMTAVFYNGDSKNLTIFGGSFTAKDSDGKVINNLLILDGKDDDKVTGLSGSDVNPNSTFLSVAVHKDTLFAGGRVTTGKDGKDQGMIAYDLKDNKMSKEQPPALDGNGVVVNYIAPLDGSSDVYVAGNFQSAAGLPCPSVCVYQMDDQSWSRPGAELDGTANVLRWSNKTTLYAAGNLTINDKKAYVATYDAKKQNWDRFYLSDKIPGPVTSLIFSNQKGSEFWIAGTKGDSNGDPFIMYYNGASIKNIGKFDKKTTITDLRVVGTKNKEGKNTQALIALGSIQVPNFGVASAAVFDPDSGDLKPFLFATDADGKPAKINGFFSEKSWTFEPGRGGRSRGIIVLVSFCISLGCVFLIVAGGIIASTIRRKRQGYVSAPQGTDRKPDLGRVPPAYLLNDLNGSPEGPGGAPMI